MYNNGNSSKNVTGASVVDGTLENADFADNTISGDKIDAGVISNFQSTGIDDRLSTGKNITVSDSNTTLDNNFAFSGTTGNKWLFFPDTANHTGRLSIQTGYGSAQAGGALTLYGHSHATNPGDVNIGMSNIIGDFTITKSVANGGSELIRVLHNGGLTFNGDTAAANALDDYEEGTWDPVIDSATVTYTAQSGTYTKIGRLVNVYCRIEVNTISGASGNLRVSGLPFAASAGINRFTGSTHIAGVNWAGDYITPYVPVSTSTVGFVETTANGSFAEISTTDVAAVDVLVISISYEV